MTGELPGPIVAADGILYWEAARQESFIIQKCGQCGVYRFPPGHLCRSCGSDDTVWVEPSGEGSIYSFSVIHRAPTPEFRVQVPYVIALIDLKEGPRMMSNIVGSGALDCAIGDKVQVCFEDRAEETKVPQFKRADL